MQLSHALFGNDYQESPVQGRINCYLTCVGSTAGVQLVLQIAGSGLDKSIALPIHKFLLAPFGFLPCSMKLEVFLIEALILSPVLFIH